MGIPKFFRWLSERYPLINQPGGATVVPIIDNLYLDMNGIIHNCTHGNNPDVKLTEDEMIVKIFTYLDKLFHIVKPQKLLFMAIDGSAPRAKMNQQRSRRFKSAREAHEAMEAAQRRGEPVPDPDTRFDSNCITPGTPFMARLGAHIRFFIRKKIAEDPAWQKPTIIFSGHDVPGEGEHKIMEYIRWQKRRPDYAPNMRHCLYGLDADLIMLSLVTHEPHFCLLREVVSFTGGGRGQPAREVLDNPCQEHFVLLQIGLLRDYFDAEFRSALEGRLPFAYDLERVVDDFVLFCMLVGNDFLPPLPTVDINEGSLDAMFALYKELLPQLGGYLTHAGELSRGRLETFMRHLASAEADVLHARAEDAEAFESKRSRGRGERGGEPAWASARVAAKRGAEEAARLQSEIDEDDAFALDMAKLALQAEGHELELLAAVEGEDEEEGEEGQAKAAVSSEPTMMSQEARNLFLNGDKDSGLAAWKARYYREKMRVSGEEGRRAVVEAYIQGLHWVLEYYYRGVASWNWFYPFHYAPMASDLVGLPAINVSFTLGKPFLPYEQLLAVQPSSSYRVLPEPYRHLMCDPSSPIIDFYPTDFQVDMEGKRADWEGVVLIPFIDQDRLLAAAASVPPERLTPEERQRNTLGDIFVFSHAPGADAETEFCASTLPAHFASVVAPNSRAVAQAAPPPLPAGDRGFVPEFVAGTKTGGSGPPGFPSLTTIKSTAELRKIGVNVFGMASRKESLILQLKGLASQLGGQQLSAAQVAGALLGQRCWVKWPYLQEAVVEAVSDAATKVSQSGGTVRHGPAEAGEWQQERHRMQQEYLHKQGVDCGEITLVLHVRPCEGLVRQVDGTIEKRFAKKEVTYPMELVVRRNPSPDPRFQPETATTSLVSYDFKPGARALFLGRSHYGCMATVLPDASAGLTKKGQQLVAGAPQQRRSVFRVSLEPGPTNMATIAQAAKRVLGNINVQYSPSGQVARRLGVSHRTLGRMTGNVWLQAGEERRDRVDVGLCVKNGGKGLYVPDFARPLMENGDAKGWAYSESLVRVLDDYRRRFPWLWAAIEMDASPAEFKLDDVLPDQEREQQLEQVAALRKWLKGLPLSRRPLVKLSAQVAPEPAVKMLQAALPPRAKEQPAIELENVAATLLLPPTEKGGMTAALAGGVFDIGDRVVAITGSGSPPFGSRGTVVGTYDEAVEVVFDAEVPGGSDLYGRCNGSCGMLLPASDLLNLSKPAAVKAEGQHAPRVVRTARQQPQAAAAGAGLSGQRRQQQPSAAAALQAAAAGLSGTPPARASKPGATAAANGTASGSREGTPGGSKQQPRIPDQPNAKGFSMGRGKSPALPPALLKKPAAQAAAAAPGAPISPPAPAAAAAAAPAPAGQAAGSMLLAQLHRSASTPNQQQPQAPAAPPAPGTALLQQLQRGVVPAPPAHGVLPMVLSAPALTYQYPPLLQALLPQAPLPQAQQGPLSPPRVPSVPPGQALLAQLQSPAKAASLPVARPAPVAPPPGLAAGSALLQQLQRPAAPAAPQTQPPPPPAPGMQLLSQLQQGSQAAAVPAPPPAAATATLLQRLQAPAAQPAQAPTQLPPQPPVGAASDLSSLWQRLQQQHTPAEAAAAAAAAPPPPAVPASLLAPAPAAPPAPVVAPPAAPAAPASGAVPAPSDLWQMLQNAGQKK